MTIWSTLKLAMRALLRNWVRSLLTMFGIVFGISAVIAMVSAGQGAQDAVRQVFDNLGTNVLIVTNGSAPTSGAAGGAGSRASLTWKDLDAITEPGAIPTLKWAAPVLTSRSQQVASDNANWNTSISGTTATWFKIRNWPAVQGSLFDDDAGSSKVAVIGHTVEKELFPTGGAIGQTIRIASQPYEVIGVLDIKGEGPGGDNDDFIAIPVKTYLQKFDHSGVQKYINRGQIVVTMYSDDQAEQTIASLTNLLREQHKLDA